MPNSITMHRTPQLCLEHGSSQQLPAAFLVECGNSVCSPSRFFTKANAVVIAETSDSRSHELGHAVNIIPDVATASDPGTEVDCRLACSQFVAVQICLSGDSLGKTSRIRYGDLCQSAITIFVKHRVVAFLNHWLGSSVGIAHELADATEEERVQPWCSGVPRRDRASDIV